LVFVGRRRRGKARTLWSARIFWDGRGHCRMMGQKWGLPELGGHAEDRDHQVSTRVWGRPAKAVVDKKMLSH
jgi:hypothetical protein